jgi:hypothetical protein
MPANTKERTASVALALPGNLLLKGAVLSEVGLTLPKETTFEQWQKVGRELGRFQRAISWWIGDWWAFGEHRYGDRKAIVESEEWTGPGFQACMDAGSVSRSFKTSRRHEVLSFEHHRCVAMESICGADTLATMRIIAFALFYVLLVNRLELFI